MTDVTTDRLLRQAIAEKRIITFTYQRLPRVGEPHDYGRRKGTGKVQLNFFQTGGQSKSGALQDWRSPEVDGISDLRLTEDRFSGTRATSSGRHIDWDELYATVTPR